VSTADWALVISICSAIVSLAGFVWNVWSKFIYPKPRVQVSFSFMRVVQGNFSGEKVLVLSATNMGPVQVTLYYALVTYSRWAPRLSSVGVLNPLHNYPAQTTHSIGPFGGGLPKKLDVGEQFSVAVSGGPGNVRDWIGIFVPGAPNNVYVVWQYLTGGQTRKLHGITTGVVSFTAPSTPGTYEVRFLSASDAGFAVIPPMGSTLIVGLPFPVGSVIEVVQPDGGVLSTPLG